MKKTKKKFDCVEMMHRGALAIYKKTKNMTREEELAWWKERDRVLREKIEATRRKVGRKAAGPRG